MISNAHVHNQTSVASLNNSSENAFNAQQVEDTTTKSEETLNQYLTASEDASLKLQLLSQRSYSKGYRGL